MSQHDTTELERVIVDALNKSVPAALRDAINDIVDVAVFKRDEFTDAISNYFSEALDGSSCFIAFSEGLPRAIAGFDIDGHLGNCSFEFNVEIAVGTTCVSSADQRAEALTTIEGINAFILRLEAERNRLQDLLSNADSDT